MMLNRIFAILILVFSCVSLTVGNYTPVHCQRTSRTAWNPYFHHRYDEVSQYDCPSNTCGGQCVALVKCACGAPHTSQWIQGYSVGDLCLHGHGYIPAGTAIATFVNGRYNNQWTDHAAIFMGCNNGNIRVIEQACEFGIRYNEYSTSSGLYSSFRAIVLYTGRRSYDNSSLSERSSGCSYRYTGC